MENKITIELTENELKLLKKSISEYQTILEERINLLRSYNIPELNETVIKSKEERINDLEDLRIKLDK